MNAEGGVLRNSCDRLTGHVRRLARGHLDGKGASPACRQQSQSGRSSDDRSVRPGGRAPPEADSPVPWGERVCFTLFFATLIHPEETPRHEEPAVYYASLRPEASTQQLGLIDSPCKGRG